MATNIEIKARIDSVERLAVIAGPLATDGPHEIAQDDTFFDCARGRLKLRAFGDGTGELIFYRRPDARGPKASFYIRSATADVATLREALSLAYGTVGRVRKQRRLFLAGRTRIHLDRVEGLGEFIELEVVLRDGEAVDDGIVEADGLMARLGIRSEDLVEGAYVDLLAAVIAADARR